MRESVGKQCVVAMFSDVKLVKGKVLDHEIFRYQFEPPH